MLMLSIDSGLPWQDKEASLAAWQTQLEERQAEISAAQAELALAQQRQVSVKVNNV
jgi:hypothetical protein